MASAQNNGNPLEEFLSQSTELVEQLDAAMMQIDPASEDAEDERYCVAQILESLRFIRGAARFVQKAQVSNFAREAAGALDKLRRADATASFKLTTTMQESVSALREAIGSLETRADADGATNPASHAAAAARAIQATHVQLNKHDDPRAAASRRQALDRIKKDV